MNRIININIAGRLIPIDDAAYEHLSMYIGKLKTYFAAENGGDEIISDMEDRIAELFQDRLKKGTPCIMQQDIDEMIEIMGSPEQIENETGTDANNTSDFYQNTGGASSGRQSNFISSNKKLSRNGRDKIIGGVCSGIANYLNIAPLIIRIAMVFIVLAWGTGIIVYLLLWALLPETNAPVTALKKRLYRNQDQKVIAGVCSGLAAYLNIDPIIPRIVFIAPLLGMIFFGILDSNVFFFPLIIGSFPTLLILYFILWAAVPRATTLTEKMEMRGEKIDVQNLSNAIKGENNEADLSQKKRPVIAQLLVIVIKVFVFMILATVLMALAGSIIGITVALLGLAGSTDQFLPITSLIIESPVQRSFLLVFLFLCLIIPFVIIIRILVYVLTGKKQKHSRLIYGITGTLFIISIFGLSWIIGRIASDFKTEYTQTYNQPIVQPNNDTMIIKQLPFSGNGSISDISWDDDDFSLNHNDFFQFKDDTTIAISNMSLHFAPSTDSQYHLNIQKSSRGRNMQRAEKLATQLNFVYSQQGNSLILPSGFNIPQQQPFRVQKINIELQIPIGKYFKTENLSRNFYSNKVFRIRKNNIKIDTENYPRLINNHLYKMTETGAVNISNAQTDSSSTAISEI